MLMQGGEGSEGLAASCDTNVIGPISLMLRVTELTSLENLE
jgi:hypothetical protein